MQAASQPGRRACRSLDFLSLRYAPRTIRGAQNAILNACDKD